MTGETRAESKPRRRLPAIPLWVALALMVAALVAAALILDRVAEPLYGLLFAEGAPVPAGAVETERVTPEQGAAYRLYRTDQPGREVAAFYEDAGGTCVYSAVPPAGAADSAAEREHNVARCNGQSESAARSGGWEVFIAEGYSAEKGPTIFRLYEY